MNRATTRIFALTGTPFCNAGAKRHRATALMASASNDGDTLASTSTAVTLPSGLTVTTSGTMTSCASTCPSGHSGGGCIVGTGGVTPSCAKAWKAALEIIATIKEAKNFTTGR